MELSPADIESLRRYGQEQAAKAAELRLKVRWLEGQNKKLERRLERVYRSWTWRAGRVVLFPYYLFQWLIERLRRSPFDK
jgi:hypothetical protein